MSPRPATPSGLPAASQLPFPDFGFMVSPEEYQAKYSDQPIFRLKTDYPLDKPAKAPKDKPKVKGDVDEQE